MKKIWVICSLLFCSVASAENINLGSGITLSALNGEKVNESESVLLVEGSNQLVLEFSGYLKKQGKREYFSAVPYVAVVTADPRTELHVGLVSNKLSTIEKNVDRNRPIFYFEIEENKIESKQFILPPSTNAFPYANISELIKSYNRENGLIFDSGKIRELKKELASVNEYSNLENKESENSLQLKLWYSRANAEERKAFKKWVIDHN
jgi:hypothetical protein